MIMSLTQDELTDQTVPAQPLTDYFADLMDLLAHASTGDELAALWAAARRVGECRHRVQLRRFRLALQAKHALLD